MKHLLYILLSFTLVVTACGKKGDGGTAAATTSTADTASNSESVGFEFKNHQCYHKETQQVVDVGLCVGNNVGVCVGAFIYRSLDGQTYDVNCQVTQGLNNCSSYVLLNVATQEYHHCL